MCTLTKEKASFKIWKHGHQKEEQATFVVGYYNEMILLSVQDNRELLIHLQKQIITEEMDFSLKEKCKHLSIAATVIVDIG